MFSRTLSNAFPSASSKDKKKKTSKVSSSSRHEDETPEQRAVRREERRKRKETETAQRVAEAKRMSGISPLRMGSLTRKSEKGKAASKPQKDVTFDEEISGVRRRKLSDASRASGQKREVRSNKHRVYMSGAAGPGDERGRSGDVDFQNGILNDMKDPPPAPPKDRSTSCHHHRDEYENVGDTIQCGRCVRRTQRKREEEVLRGRARDQGRKISAGRKEKPKRTVTCVSCLDDDILASEAAQLSCDHNFCHACLIRLFTLSLTDPAHMPPKCCSGTHIPLHHVSPLISNQTKRLWNRKYREFTTKNKVYCSSPTCGEWIPPERIHDASKLGKCKKCGTKTCSMCNGLAHGTEDCPKDPDIIKFLETAEKEGYQRCYSCKSYVELERGCNHMRCRCDASFCYVCGMKWKTCNCPWFNATPPDAGGEDADLALINDGGRPLPALPLQHFLNQIPQLLPITAQRRARARQIRDDERLARRLERELRLADGINLSDLSDDDNHHPEQDEAEEEAVRVAAAQEWERQRMALPEGGTLFGDILNNLGAVLGIQLGAVTADRRRARSPSPPPPRPPMRDPIRLPPTPPPPSPPPRPRDQHRQARRVPSAGALRRPRVAMRTAPASAVNASGRSSGGSSHTRNVSDPKGVIVREIPRSPFLSDNKQNTVERFLRTLPEEPPAVEEANERAVKRERRRGGERLPPPAPPAMDVIEIRRSREEAEEYQDLIMIYY